MRVISNFEMGQAPIPNQVNNVNQQYKCKFYWKLHDCPFDASDCSQSTDCFKKIQNLLKETYDETVITNKLPKIMKWLHEKTEPASDRELSRCYRQSLVARFQKTDNFFNHTACAIFNAKYQFERFMGIDVPAESFFDAAKEGRKIDKFKKSLLVEYELFATSLNEKKERDTLLKTNN